MALQWTCQQSPNLLLWKAISGMHSLPRMLVPWFPNLSNLFQSIAIESIWYIDITPISLFTWMSARELWGNWATHSCLCIAGESLLSWWSPSRHFWVLRQSLLSTINCYCGLRHHPMAAAMALVISHPLYIGHLCFSLWLHVHLCTSNLLLHLLACNFFSNKFIIKHFYTDMLYIIHCESTEKFCNYACSN